MRKTGPTAPAAQILFCSPERSELLREKLALREPNSCLSPADFSAAHEENPIDQIYLLDLESFQQEKISPASEWKEKRIVLLYDRPCPPEWQLFSRINLQQTKPEISTALDLCSYPENFPGIFGLLKSKGEIFYEKIESLHEIGLKVDKLTHLLGQKFPELQTHFFSLRQTSYALLHLALNESSAKIKPIADFQVSANEGGIYFAVRFNATLDKLKSWQALEADTANQIWKSARDNSTLLAITYLEKIQQVEVKARIGATLPATAILQFSISDFNPDSSAQKLQASFTFTPLGKLTPPPNATNDETPAITAEEPKGTELNFKVKADMLENEKNNLQGLVKKKSVLIGELTKDVNRAQQEVIAAQKNATKEILGMRMETEKAKNAAREATKKLSIFQRKMAEKEAEQKAAEATPTEPVRDFEKDLKQSELILKNSEQKLAESGRKIARLEEFLARQRKETGELMQELNNLKAEKVKSSGTASKAADPLDPSGTESTEEKLKSTKKILAETMTKEHELEKEVKRLQIKCDAAEKNLAAKAGATKKELEAAEKSVEESKRQKSLISSKMEELKTELKKKIEESNSAERLLKAKVDELTESVKKKEQELEKQNKKVSELVAKISEYSRKAA